MEKYVEDFGYSPSCLDKTSKISDILPILLDIPYHTKIEKLSPSRLNRELRMPLKERLEQLCKPTRKYRIHNEKNNFNVTPDVIIFQNYSLGEAHKVSVSIQNMHKVSKYLKVKTLTAPNFFLSCPNESTSKLAPGMVFTINLIFTPVEIKPCVYEIIVLTDDDSINIPVYALGHQPILNIPDQIILPTTVVRVPSKKTVLLHNQGGATACYVVTCEKPFKVSPVRGSVRPDETKEIVIICTSTQLCSFKSQIHFIYNSINLTVDVKCEIKEAEIFLDNTTFFFGEIYLALSSYKKLSIINKSSYNLTFRWMQHSSVEIDEVERAKVIKAAESVIEMEKMKYNKLEYTNVVDAQGHAKILDRSSKDVERLNKDYEYLYKNKHFRIIPTSGEILARQTLDFTIIFTPSSVMEYDSVAYLDVTGISKRLSVNFLGKGKGPKIIFNSTVLNLNSIFLKAPYKYECLIKNVGQIPATISFKKTETEFGGRISCVPSRLTLQYNGDCDTFILEFISNNKGPFIERIEFILEESGEIVYFLLKGNIVCPLLQANVNRFDLGELPCGIDVHRTFLLVNNSQVPIDFSISMDKILTNNYKFSPATGCIQQFSKQDIEMTIHPDNIMEIQNSLVVRSWEDKEISLRIPVTYASSHPNIECNLKAISIPFCFISYHYTRSIKLKNESKILAVLTYTAEKLPPGFTCDLEMPRARLNPLEEVTVNMTIFSDIVGSFDYPLVFKINCLENQIVSRVICNFSGPVIVVEPMELNFGPIRCLQDFENSLRLINDSPIGANVKVHLEQNSPLTLNVMDFDLPPEKSLSLLVKIYLTCSGRFQEVISFVVENGETIRVPVTAVGLGHSIFVDPPIEPEYDAGMLLTHKEFRLSVTFTNLGKKFYRVLLIPNKDVPKSTHTLSSKPAESIFKINPLNFDLAGGQQVIAEITAMSKRSKYIAEEFHCFAIKDKSLKPALLFSFILKGNFIEPTINFSDTNLQFQVGLVYRWNDSEFQIVDSQNHDSNLLTEKKLNSESTFDVVQSQKELENRTLTTLLQVDRDRDIKEVMLENILPIKLAMELFTSEYFYFVIEKDRLVKSLTLEIAPYETAPVLLCFKPAITEKRFSSINGTLQVNFLSHPKTDILVLTGDICYPTIVIPQEHDFGCVPIDGNSKTNFLLQNVTFCHVKFSWKLVEDELVIEKLPNQTRDDITSLLTNLSEDDVIFLDQMEWPDETSETSKSSEATDYSKIQISRTSQNQISMTPSSIDDTNYNKPKTNMLTKKIISNLLDTYDDSNAEFFKPAIVFDRRDPYEWKDIFNIEPWRGFLECYEFCSINMKFTPPPNTKIRAVMQCAVDGGESERIIITGVCSTISYKFDQDYVEFGQRIYSEICESKITLTNTGSGYFNLRVKCDPLVNRPYAKWLNVTITKKQVHPQEQVTFIIKYFPGITGEFKKSFSVIIDYLKPLEIMVHGFATFVQVTPSLERYSKKEYDLLHYKAISQISVRYLHYLYPNKYLTEPTIPEDIPYPQFKDLLLNDWVIITKDMIYPSIKDIDLAFERTLLNRSLSSSRYSIRQSREIRSNAYLVNFGPVTVGTPVCYTINLLNNGPIATELKVLKETCSSLEKDEFRLEFQIETLNVGCTQKMYVIFKPTKNKYGTHEVCVKNSFELRVKQGIVIPFILIATVTLPKIELKQAEIHFGEVLLGQAVRHTVSMYNSGYISNDWSAEVILSNREVKFKSFIVIPNSGKLAPEETTLLNIYFLPRVKGEVNASINVTLIGNPNPKTLKLNGVGYEPILIIENSFMKFKTILPFKTTSLELFINNLSNSTIEYTFPDFDRDYIEETYMIEAYLLYNKLQMVLVPRRDVNKNLNDNIQGCYHFFINQIRHNSVGDLKNVERETISDPLEKYSREEIFEMVKDYIETLLTEKDTTMTETLFNANDDCCPVIGILEDDKPTPSSVNVVVNNKEGVFIVFHGAPSTEYYKIANKVGIAYSLPVYSIDRLIYEEVVANKCNAANEFIETIDKKLKQIKVILTKYSHEDDYDFIQRKYDFLIEFELEKTKRKFKHGDYFLDFPSDVIGNLLKTKLKSFKNGAVIESLHTTFTDSVQIILKCLLNALNDAFYVNLIILNQTFNHYLETEVRNSEDAKGEEIISKVKIEMIEKRPKSAQNLKYKKPEFDAFKSTLGEITNICQNWNKVNDLFTSYQSTTGKLYKNQRRKNTRSSLKVASQFYDTGIPLWIVQTPSLDWEGKSDLIINSLNNNEYMVKALQNLETPNKKSLIETTTTFTVLSSMVRKCKPTSDVFQIVNMDLNEESSHTLSEITQPSRRKKTRLPTAKPMQISSQSLKVKVKLEFKPRMIIEPGKSVGYKINFVPQTTGQYNYEYFVQMIGYFKNYVIGCEANCELPQIDFTPGNVFPQVLDDIALKSIHDNFVYVKDKNTFYFGPVLIGNPKTPSYKTTITLNNLSKMPCYITAYTDDVSMFTFEDGEISLGPKQTYKLDIYVKPLRKCYLQSNFYISIKYNPKVFNFVLNAKSCFLDFIVTPKTLTFEKVPLNFSYSKKFMLRNGSIVNLWWKLKNLNALKKSFKINPTNGPLKAYSIEEVTVEYKSEVEENVNFHLQLEVFDFNCSNEIPFHTDIIVLQASSVEYIAEYDEHINLGDIKGKKLQKWHFDITNKGKCNIFFRVSEITNVDEHKATRKYFTLIGPKFEIINPHKTATVNFQCVISKEVKMERVPLYMCHFLDKAKVKANVIKTFFIYVSGEVFLSKYEVCPPTSLYFGHQQIMSKSVQSIELKNVGKFPFIFNLQYVSNKINSGNSSPQKSNLNKLKFNLQASCFAVTPTFGEVQPGKSMQLDIQCFPSEAKEYKERLLLNVSESAKDSSDSEEIWLYVTGAEPLIDLKNIYLMYKEHFILKRFKNFLPPKKTEAYCVFASTEQTLYFSRVCINTEKIATIYLSNINQVLAKVSIKLEVNNDENFHVQPSKLFINSTQAEPIFISFKPTYIGTSENSLVISYNKVVDNKYVLKLIGQSCIPQVKLLEPKCNTNNVCNVNLPLSYINEKQACKISVQNIGVIPCKIIIDIRNNEDKDFNMEVCEDSIKCLNMDLIDFRTNTNSTLLKLNEDEIGNFLVYFRSQKESIQEILVKIHTVNNPYDIYNIKIRGQCYYTDVILKGLPIETKEEKGLVYQLYFGNIFLENLETKKFWLENNSENVIYKFEFTVIPPLTILPKVGHLLPGTKKEIIASVFSQHVFAAINELLQFNYIPIEFENVENEIKYWDDRQVFVVDESRRPSSDSKNVATSVRSLMEQSNLLSENCKLLENEPEIHYMQTNWNTAAIMFSVNVDYARYECEVTKIHYPLTYVQEKNVVEFKIENKGHAPLIIDWTLESKELDGALVHSESYDFDNLNEEDELNTNETVSDMSLFSATHQPVDGTPFSVEPQHSKIEANDSAKFSVIFSPLTAGFYQYILKTNLPCLDPALNELQIDLKAKSQIPLFYFEIEESDLAYVANVDSQRNDGKVISFESVGIGDICTKCFNLVNRYSEAVSFTFQQKYRDNFSYFICETPYGEVRPNKKFEAIFKFAPIDTGIYEDNYVFYIDNRNYQVTFLLMGTCREVKVSFTTPHLTLPNCVLGMTSEGTLSLRNDENFSVSFKFLPDTLSCENGDELLKITPMEGKLEPKKDTEIHASCYPSSEGLFHFLLKCSVERKRIPMAVNVSLSCLEILSSVMYTKLGKTYEMYPDRDNIIDIGNVPVNVAASFKIIIENVGELGFYYTWFFNKKEAKDCLKITVDKDNFVPSMCAKISYFHIEPLIKQDINNFKLSLQITYGKTYVIRLNGSAKTTQCKFSFTNYDFRYCVIQKRKAKLNKVDLVLKNMERQPLMVENSYPNNPDLTVDLQSALVPVNSSLNIPIYFHPQKVGHYNFIIPIYVNSQNFPIKLKGECVLPDIQLLKPNDKYIDLGKIIKGTVKRRVIHVVNRTPTTILASINLLDNLPSVKTSMDKIDFGYVVPRGTSLQLEKTLKRKRSMRLSTIGSRDISKIKMLAKSSTETIQSEPHSLILETDDLFLKDCITVLPKDTFEMNVNKKYDIVLEIQAKEKAPKFSTKLYYEVDGLIEPLCVIRGSFIASMYDVDKNVVTFSNVVVGYKCTKELLLMNKGDLIGKYRWSIDEYTNIFSISPERGVLKPNSKRVINVTFSPNTVQCQFLSKIHCYIGDDPPLEVVLTGNSTEVPEPKALIQFDCPIGSRVTKTIRLTNPTVDTWHVKTTHSNQSWSVLKQIDIPAEETINFDIIFAPLLIAKEPFKDMLRLEFPEGKLQLYKLKGVILPPLPIEKVSCEVHCKSWYTQVLRVENKLNSKQCYQVTTELVTDNVRGLFNIQGLELIEILPNKAKSYLWNLYIFNEVPMDFKVKFTSLDGNEYFFYEIHIDPLPATPIDTIHLVTCVRELTKSSIKLVNPFNRPVTFEISCNMNEIITEKMVHLDATTSYNLHISYFPLISGTFSTILEATSDELGVYPYQLQLVAKPAPFEEKMIFRVELGESIENFSELKNQFGVLLDLSAQFDNPAFSMKEPLTILPGRTGKFVVSFEPNDVGLFQGIGTLTSPHTGDFVYPLLGKGLAPSPKGPFCVRSGGTTVITFTNPFAEQHNFLFKIQSKYFKVNPDSEKINSKKSTKIVVQLINIDVPYPVTGRLTVMCDDEAKKDILWVFYLQSEKRLE